MPYFLYQNKTNIYYNDSGKGNVVILLHGFGETSAIWNSQHLFLQNTHRVIAPDLPGSGHSELINQDDVTIDDYANCIYELLKHLQLNTTVKVSVLGHSMGGYIALAFAKKYSDDINAFGLIHSTAYSDSTEKKQIRLRAIETMQQYGSYSFLKTTIPNLFSRKFKETESQKINDLIEQGKRFSPISLEQYYKAMINRSDSCDLLQKTKLPILFIAGIEDTAAPLNDLLHQFYLSEKSQIKILDNVGHMGMLEASEDVNNVIAQFLFAFDL